MALKQHYIACGLSTRVHGNTKRLPKNALTYREIQNVLKFLKSYAQANAILLPGRIPGYKQDDLQLLPSTTTKKVSAVNLLKRLPMIKRRCFCYTGLCIRLTQLTTPTITHVGAFGSQLPGNS